MDEFAALPPSDREPYIRETAARMNISEVIIEKDFWVCWVLEKLFSLKDLRGHLIFKGGTSLSKCYGVIQRFSEDIDVSISREYLGFGGDNDPARQSSGKRKKAKVEELGAACTAWVSGALRDQLGGLFAILNDQEWELTVDPDDKDLQTLQFAYPSAIVDSLPYIRKAVKIELGARSDHWPADEKQIIPYIAQHFPQAITASSVPIHVLDIRRTFWEKVTLLHAEYHREPDMPMPPRLSRHLYDLWAIAHSTFLEDAIDDHTLLADVVAHKQVFFKSGRAHYECAKPGTLKICPPEKRHKELERDYAAMRQMIFSDPPTFKELMDTMGALEKRINK
ncbi:MAG: nucleotidyl transferase AbiEii/AbiGii toxin family protein [Oceanipulchritudo sp.]